MTMRFIMDAPVHQALIFGPPQPQGSKDLVTTRTGQTLMIEANAAKHRSWRQEVIQSMLNDRPQFPYDIAVEIRLLLHVRRPRAHYNSKGRLKSNAPPFAKSGRDQDKVARAVGDAAKMAGWVFDDSRIAHWDIWRVYIGEGEPERTLVTMRELTIEDAERLGLALPIPEKENLDKPLLTSL